MLSRKQKPYDTIINDPNLHYYLGRIVGVAEISSELLMNQDSPDVKKIGENLSRAVSWFFAKEETDEVGWLK